MKAIIKSIARLVLTMAKRESNNLWSERGPNSCEYLQFENTIHTLEAQINEMEKETQS